MTEKMSDHDRSVILAYAMGDHEKRDAALEVYRRCIPADGETGDDYHCFMDEVDHPRMDISRRMMYRSRLIKQHENLKNHPMLFRVF